MGQSQASRAISLDETASIQLRNAHAELQVYRTAVAQEQERSRRLDGAIYRLRREDFIDLQLNFKDRQAHWRGDDEFVDEEASRKGP